MGSKEPSRRYPQRPLLGVGALILRRNSILLVERAKPPLKGYWSLPGGLVETGEHLEDAIRREVLEETGLTVTPLSVFEIFERIMRDKEGKPEYHYVLIDYLCKAKPGKPAAASDAGRADWIQRTKLRELKLTEGTLEVIEKAFERQQ